MTRPIVSAILGSQGGSGGDGVQLSDDAVLDLAKATRATADRGKFLGTAADNENELALLDAPSSSSKDAANVTVSASGFDGNLAPTDNTVQKALQKFDDYAPSDGLNASAVNAAIDARVPVWARMTQRWTDEEREAIHAFTGDAWQQSDDIQVATTWSSVVRPANPENLTFVKTTNQGPHYTNVYAVVRLKTSRKNKLNLARFSISDSGVAESYHQFTTLDSASGVTFLEDELGWSYYTVAVADYPAGEPYQAELLVPFELDPDKVAGLPAEWAERGNTDLVPSAKLPVHVSAATQFELVSPGITLARTDGDHAVAAPYELTPIMVLTASSRGEFHWSLDLTIAPVSDVNMSFVRGKANATAADRQVNLTTILFASDLWQEGLWTTAAKTNGLEMFEVPVYSLNTLVGTYTILLVRQTVGSEVHARPYWFYEGAAGATGATLTAELRGSFTKGDAPVVASGRSFLVEVGTGTNKDVTAPTPSSTGGWSPSVDIFELPAVTAAQAGRVRLEANLYGQVVQAASGGGDRVIVHSRLIRMRGSTSFVLATQIDYAPRNLQASANTTSTAFATASKIYTEEIGRVTDAEEGDIFKVTVRIVQQQTTGAARTLRFNIRSENWFQMTPVGA